jgi:hypothetical protein
MSRRAAIAAGLAGAIAGAIAGIPYLTRFGDCSEAGSQSVQCTMNHALGPYLSAIAVGMVLALIIGNAVAAVTRRTLAPRVPDRKRSLDAVEIDDPAIQIAAWGMPPGASQRTVSLSEPGAYRSRRARANPTTAPSRTGAGYGAAHAARASMMATGRNRP